MWLFNCILFSFWMRWRHYSQQICQVCHSTKTLLKLVIFIYPFWALSENTFSIIINYSVKSFPFPVQTAIWSVGYGPVMEVAPATKKRRLTSGVFQNVLQTIDNLAIRLKLGYTGFMQLYQVGNDNFICKLYWYTTITIISIYNNILVTTIQIYFLVWGQWRGSDFSWFDFVWFFSSFPLRLLFL